MNFDRLYSYDIESDLNYGLYSTKIMLIDWTKYKMMNLFMFVEMEVGTS